MRSRAINMAPGDSPSVPNKFAAASLTAAPLDSASLEVEHEEKATKFNWISIFAIMFLGCLVVISIVLFRNTTHLNNPFPLKVNEHSQNYLKSCAIQAQNNASHFTDEFHVVVLSTKLAGVSYEGGHWFHMAENYLTHHSVLESETEADNFNPLRNKHYVFVLDNSAFVDDMNAITRPRFAHFVAIAKKNWNSDDILSTLDKISKGKSVDLSSMVPVKERFVKTISSEVLIKESKNACVYLLGIVGGAWPTVQRGHWFPRGEADVMSLRSKIALLCQAESRGVIAQKTRGRFKLVIYQRDQSRKLANELEAIDFIRRTLPRADLWDVQVLMHSSSRSPCELAHMLFDADVLLTPHGFQSMLLLFLPRPAILFEVFPYKYYKRGYGPLSGEYGVIHAGIMSPPTSFWSKVILSGIQSRDCMKSKECRNYARNHDVKLTLRGAARLSEVVLRHLFQLEIGIQGNNNSRPLAPCRVGVTNSSEQRDFLYIC